MFQKSCDPLSDTKDLINLTDNSQSPLKMNKIFILVERFCSRMIMGRAVVDIEACC